MAETVALIKGIYRFLKTEKILVNVCCTELSTGQPAPALEGIQTHSVELPRIPGVDNDAPFRLIMECTGDDPVFRYYWAGLVPPYTLAVINWPFRQPETQGNRILVDEGLAVPVSPGRWKEAILRHCSGNSPGKDQPRQLGFGF